jgi:hypothetical protein
LLLAELSSGSVTDFVHLHTLPSLLARAELIIDDEEPQLYSPGIKKRAFDYLFTINRIPIP